MTRFFKTTTVLLLLLFLICGNLIAGDRDDRKPILSLKVGGVLSSEIEYRPTGPTSSNADLGLTGSVLPSATYSSSVALSLGGSLDFPVSRILTVGAAVDLNRIDCGSRKTGWAVIWSAHGLIGPPRNLEKVVIRPGLGVGFSVFQDTPAALDSDHLVIKALLQVGWESSRKIGWMLETTVFAYGFTDMNESSLPTQVRPKPHAVFRLGVVF